MRDHGDRGGRKVVPNALTLADESGHGHAVRDPEIVRASLDQAALGTVADEQQPRLGPLGDDERECREQRVEVGPRVEASDEHDVTAAGIQLGALDRLGPGQRFEQLEVDAVGNDRDPVWGDMSKVDQ